MRSIYKTTIIGLGATFLIDCWSLFLKLAGVSSKGLMFVGRWIGYMTEGTFLHATIMEAPPLENELIIGWITHYIIGVAFAFLLVSLYGREWIDKPRLTPAMLIAGLTLVFPIFIVQPSLGFGIGFSKMPNQFHLLVKAVLIHVVYGAGLYLSAKVLKAVTSKGQAVKFTSKDVARM